MFPASDIEAITNGIHAQEWTSDAMKALFDQKIPAWRRDNFYLKNACELEDGELLFAHQKAKDILCQEIKTRAQVDFDPDVFTIGFARRAAEYKRANLIFHDTQKLVALAAKHGKIQIVYAGKAHPKDLGGKKLIKDVVAGSHALNDDPSSNVKVVYLENYDMDLGRLITTGVDIWLNNPVKPLEASGTSGMKAALNGVPNLSTLDGWWVEGHIENVTGWEIEDEEDAFGADKAGSEYAAKTAEAIYTKLDLAILPIFYHSDRSDWANIMRQSISINGSFFNTHRMMLQYRNSAYLL
jgi:starch phosphorylase